MYEIFDVSVFIECVEKVLSLIAFFSHRIIVLKECWNPLAKTIQLFDINNPTVSLPVLRHSYLQFCSR